MIEETMAELRWIDQKKRTNERRIDRKSLEIIEGLNVKDEGRSRDDIHCSYTSYTYIANGGTGMSCRFSRITNEIPSHVRWDEGADSQMDS